MYSFKYLFTLLGLTIFQFATAQSNKVLVNDKTKIISLDKYSAFYIDTTNQKTIHEVSLPTFQAYFQPCFIPFLNKGLVHSKKTYWFKVEIQNNSTKNRRFILDVKNPLLDNVQIYVQNSQKKYVKLQYGDNIPTLQRTVPIRLPTTDVSFASQEVKTIYVRVQTDGLLRVPLFLSTLEFFYENSIEDALLTGFILGLLVLYGLASLSAWFYTRAKIYLYFSSYIFLTTILFLQLNGYLSTYFAPPSLTVFLSNQITVFLVFWSLGFLTLFVISLIQVPRGNYLYKFIKFFLGIYAVLPFLFWQLNNYYLAILNLLAAIFARLFLFVISLFFFRKTNLAVFVYIYLAAVLAVIGLLFYAFQPLGWASANVLLFHIIEITAFVEAGILGLGIVYKSSITYKQMHQSERLAIKELQKSKENLEHLIQQRTLEIETMLQTLQEKERLFRNLVETMQAGVFIHQDFHFKYVNAYLASMLGYSLDELYQKDITDIIHADYIRLVKERYTRRMESEEIPRRYDIQAYHKSGAVLWLDLSSTKIDYNGSPAALGTIYDITSTKQVYEKLAQQNLALEQTIKNQEMMQNQLIESAKMSALGKLIANVAHELNTPLAAIHSSVQSLQRAVERVIQDLQPILQYLSPSKRVVFFDLLSKIHFEDETISLQEKRKIKENWIVTLHENKIPHTRRIAEILMNIQAKLNINQLMPLLRHPKQLEVFLFINNVSNIVKSCLNIAFASQQASKTVTTLKTYARQERNLEKTYINLRQNFETVLALHKHHIKHGVEVKIDISDTLIVNCYADEITQVWSNLINNALQAMNYKGVLEIKAKETEQNVLVAITDTGTGIPEEVQKHIFEPFFTTKPVGIGNGLGLDIVKKIVEKHQGHIFFETKIGIGTTFFVEIPKR